MDVAGSVGFGFADLSNPQSLNLYSYVLNNPLSFSDPNGLYCAWEDGTSDDDPSDGGASHSDCDAQGGHWTDQSNPCHGAAGCTATFDWNPPSKTCVSSALRNVVARGEVPGEPNNGYGTLVKGTVVSAPPEYANLIGSRNAHIADPSSLSGNPGIKVLVKPATGTKPALYSTAFGRSQFTKGTAKGLGMNSFSPSDQDAAANKLMGSLGMVDDAMQGNIEQAIRDGSVIQGWASLPGSPAGQGGISMDTALTTYGQSIVGCQ